MPASAAPSAPVARSVDAEPAPDPLAWLSPAERYAYDYFVARARKGGSETYPLSPEVNASLFEVYLRGRGVREIHALQKNRFSLGQVVHAAVEGEWPRRRQQLIEERLEEAKVRALQAATDGVEYVADGLAAAARLQRERVSRYLETGDPADLGTADFSVASVQKLAETLLKLTGQDRVTTQKTVHSGAVDHRFVPVAPPPTDPAATLASWAKEAAAKKLS